MGRKSLAQLPYPELYTVFKQQYYRKLFCKQIDR